MTDVDTSFYPRPEPMNPLTMYGDIQKIGGQMLHNRAAQMDLQYNNALMQANAASVDPQTGTLDVNRRNALLSQMPGGGLNLQKTAVEALPLNAPTQYLQKGPDGQYQQRYAGAQSLGAQLNPQQQQAIDSTHDKLDALHDAAMGLANNPNPSTQDAVDSFGNLVAGDHLSPKEAAVVMSDPNDPMPQNDPQALRGWGMRHAQKIGQTKQRLNQVAPRTQAQTPFEQHLMQPDNQGNDQSGMPSVAAAPPLGIPQNIEANVGRGQNLETAAQGYPGRKAILGNLEAANQQFTSGPLSHDISVAKKASNEILGTHFGEDKVKAQEEFAKNAFQLAQQQFQALGGTGTDAKLGSAMSTSPSEMLSSLGNQGIIHMLKGNEDAIRTMNEEWQKYKANNGPGSYDKFITEFNKTYDPRIFQAKYMAPKERAAMIKGMSDQEKEQFKQNYNDYHLKGWVQ